MVVLGKLTQLQLSLTDAQFSKIPLTGVTSPVQNRNWYVIVWLTSTSIEKIDTAFVTSELFGCFQKVVPKLFPHFLLFVICVEIGEDIA